jgi:hypothetical protein
MARNPQFTLYLSENYDETLLPIPATKYKDWWEDNNKTKSHARHCLPLAMANSVGYYILSPGTFKVTWNGNLHENAQIEHIEKSSHYEVDNHAAYASFTVQSKFIPVTERAGEFIYIKSLPNERTPHFTCMEAMIEAWWNVGNFGLVFLLTKPGEIIIQKGQPIAHMLVYYGQAGASTYSIHHGLPAEHAAWLAKRTRPDYRKDLDYLRGYKYNGEKVECHLNNWKNASIYDHSDDCDDLIIMPDDIPPQCPYHK